MSFMLLITSIPKKYINIPKSFLLNWQWRKVFRDCILEASSPVSEHHRTWDRWPIGAAEEQREAGEPPVLSPRTTTRCLLSVENTLEGIRETLEAVVRRLDIIAPIQPVEGWPNLQWGAQRRRGAEYPGGYRNQERRINQFRRRNRRKEQWLENQNHNQDWSSSSEDVESDATMNNRGHRFAPYRERRAKAYEYKMKFDLPIYDAEHKKVHLVALKLKGGASAWWDQVAVNRQKQGRQPIRSWEKIKKLMKQRFLPPNYDQTLYTQYQNCRQGSQKTAEYIEEFHRLGARTNLMESEQHLIARFTGGLRTNRRRK
ncbi:transposon Ty3-I Gag-Pol polyprotein isoform X1 [Cucumis melo var. makuwa]|uniref:Transposon Ty3-I Gag-Pol polyprotein isoform X1 n=1 Tax=Cucumis melo var. makuwa TaxID=1194695 RepID=A0A5A7UXL3_CUCMM|nr:transposon Ty3-I Gag-Pol polyprotein isoform X1 [Cucumis melo var. makuwa]